MIPVQAPALPRDARVVKRLVLLLVAAWLGASPAAAACGNGTIEAGEDCDDGSMNGSANSCCTSACHFAAKYPDVVVGDLMTPLNYGTVGGITAYSIGTTSCNLGSCWLNWFESSPEHPVIGQNMFRLKNGRFEQIGQSWLKHGFTALAGVLCSLECDAPPNGNHLGVNCSDPYAASLNGTQSRLGPKADVNPSTGTFPYPDARIPTFGNAIFKRLQVHTFDLDPALNAGASYFVEGQYVTRDDATAARNSNNASYRKVNVGAAPGYGLTFVGLTQMEKAAVQAWKAADPAVTETHVVVPADGKFLVAARATSLGAGMYHYEYAIQNLTSHRAAQSFQVAFPPGSVVTNIGFHDVDYHSGEPFDGTDWTPTLGATTLTWATQTYATNEYANALRWGTLYNFRFDANVAPTTMTATLGLFRPGSPTAMSILTVAPGACSAAEGACGNGADDDCDGLFDCADPDCCGSSACAAGDGDGDHVSALCDCDDTNPTVYPGAPELCDSISNDCDAPGWPALPASELDGDGDGVRGCDGDCDDANPARFPGNPEVCDGIDNDCAGGLPLAERDLDDDGVSPCAGDCDDSNRFRTPGRLELCDGIDNDCDGIVPAGEADADEDGVRGCAGDCDDEDPARRPGNPEICDGIDNDCDGALAPDEVDSNGDSIPDCFQDCDPANSQVWATPGEVRNLTLSRPGGTITLTWAPPLYPGGWAPRYDVLRSPEPGDFLSAADCVEFDVTATSAIDLDPVASGEAAYYLVRCENDCPNGAGPLGSGSPSVPRTARPCP